MTLLPSRITPPRFTQIGVLALALAAATSAGAASASSEPPDSPPAGGSMAPADGAPGCAEITAVLDGEDALIAAFLSEDESLGTVLATLPALGEAAVAAAPPEIADQVATWVEPLALIGSAIEGADLSDLDALEEVLSSVPPAPDSGAAGEEVRRWATENCGYESATTDPFADAPEPPECEILDAAAAAEAAGVDVDVTDADGGADVSLPGFWTKSCSYGNGAISLSTISYNSIDQAIAFYEDNLPDTGEILDVELGTLPASTLVTASEGFVLVSVLDASVPFSVGFSEESVTPEAAVAAAEAVFAALPDDVPPPMTSEAPSDGTAPATTTG